MSVKLQYEKFQATALPMSRHFDTVPDSKFTTQVNAEMAKIGKEVGEQVGRDLIRTVDKTQREILVNAEAADRIVRLGHNLALPKTIRQYTREALLGER